MSIRFIFPRKLTPRTIFSFISYVTGRYLPSDITSHHRRIISSLRPGDIAIDVGANVGLISFVMALYGARVHSFEPNTEAFKSLNKLLGEWPGITLNQAAVSNHDGAVKLYLHERHDEEPSVFSTGSSIKLEKGNVDKDNWISVQSVDLARYIIDLGRPIKILKMDIEGAEVDVIPHLIETGAIDLIEYVFVEIHDKKNPDLKTSTQAMRDSIERAGVSEKIHLDWH